ncbi:Ku protein [Streptomyces sp. NPDC085900]|uniref:Ku protein n=1 Tax=Streptomyces sp. NPDC085900 TaxID=3365737 RepID=UPI0037D74678
MAVAKYAWSGRERLGLLRVREDVLVLHAMRWPDEIRDPAEILPPPVDVDEDEDEIKGALALVDTMTREDLHDEEFHDTYTEALAKVIEAKRGDQPLPEAPETEEQPGKVLDLMAALQESVQKARTSRGETGGADVHDLSTAKKSPAKKTAKKTTGRKPRSA